MELSNRWCEALYEAKAADLILYGRSLGLSHAEAEDVVHDTFLALLQREGPPREPEFYCLRSFRNRALNYRRGLWRRLTRELESWHWFESSEELSEAERTAMRALPRLPRGQREVIVLKVWHGMTFAAIGELLELSPHTAAGRYRYGMQKLEAILTRDSYESIETVGGTIEVVEPAPAFRQA